MRYAMLETLRGYGAGLLAGAGEQDQAQAALARYAVGVAEEAGAGLQIIAGELAAARWLDAEDATMAHVLGWAVEHDLDTAVRMVTALSVWWVLRGRLAGQQPLLRELAGRAEPGSEGWCTAQFWLAWTAFDAADLPGALQLCAAVIDVIGDREPSRLLVDCLDLQSAILSNLGRVPEAAAISRRALAMARELGYPFGQAFATGAWSSRAWYAGDLDEAAQLARQAGQIPDIPGTAARLCGFLLAGVLAEAGDLAAAGQACAAALAEARDAGDMYNLHGLLPIMADLDLRAGRTAEAAARLHEAAQVILQTGLWFMMLAVLEGCGYLCAATGRPADAVTAWAAQETIVQQGGFATRRGCAAGKTPCARPGGARPGPGPRSRRAREGDEPGHRGRICPDAHRPGLGAAWPAGPAGQAQRAGTGTGYPGRPGPYRRPDRRRAVHQHPHRLLAPGPDPGQDRLPPPRRPDPPGPDRRTGLAILPGQHSCAAVTAPVGSRQGARLPGAACRSRASAVRAGGFTHTPERGESAPAPRPARPASLSGEGRTSRPYRQEQTMFAHLSRRGPSPRTARPRPRRLAAVTCGLLASAAAVPGAVAMTPTPQPLVAPILLRESDASTNVR